MSLLVFYVSLSLGVSFVCSVLEAVLLSVTPSYVAKLKDDRPALGEALGALKDDVDRPLVAVLTLNTIAHTIGAAGAGAQAQDYFGSQWLGVFSGVLTLLILVLSEIIPKTLGAVYWRKLVPVAVKVLQLLLAPPFGWLVSASQLITRALKKGDAATHGHQVSKEEFQALAKLGEQQGVFDESESRILKNIFLFGSLKTRDIMTPRTVMFALPHDKTVGSVVPVDEVTDDDATQRSTMAFSRIPVFRDSPDDVLGYVLKDDLYLRAARDQLTLPVGELVRPFEVVPDTLPVATLFERLLDKREHIALVVDEYGGVDGVVTMEDVLETMLGLEIVDEADEAVDLREIARRRWRERVRRMGVELVDSRRPEEAS